MLDAVKVRRILGLFATVLVAVAVAACGGVSTDPTSSPADTVPANAVFYASATVQPSGSQLQTLQQVIDKVGGAGTASKLLNRLQQAMTKSHHGVSFAKDVAPWLGQQVGVAITRWPAALANGGAAQHGSAIDPYMALIFPTAHPAAAKQALTRLEKNGKPKNMTAEVSGNYLLLGGKQAINAIDSTPQGSSLASNPNYQADLAKLEPDSLATLYVNTHSFQPFLTAALQRSPGGSSLLNSLPKLSANSTEMLGLSATSNTVRLDVVSSGSSKAPASPASVSGLPGDSWLAVSTPSLSAAQLKSLAASMQVMAAANVHASGGMNFQSQTATKTAANASFSPASGSSPVYVSSSTKSSANPAKSLAALQSLMPLLFKSGLGPMHFSLAGTSIKGLHAGLSLSDKDATSAKQLAQMIYTFAQLGKAKLSGSPSSFTIAVNKQMHVDAGTSGSDVVATLGYPSLSAFASPSSTLANNSIYQQAVSQLPSSDNVSLFANFDGISKLLASAPHAAANKQALTTLKRFSYAIVGGTSDHMRVVLGLH